MINKKKHLNFSNNDSELIFERIVFIHIVSTDGSINFNVLQRIMKSLHLFI